MASSSLWLGSGLGCLFHDQVPSLNFFFISIRVAVQRITRVFAHALPVRILFPSPVASGEGFILGLLALRDCDSFGGFERHCDGFVDEWRGRSIIVSFLLVCREGSNGFEIDKLCRIRTWLVSSLSNSFYFF